MCPVQCTASDHAVGADQRAARQDCGAERAANAAALAKPLWSCSADAGNAGGRQPPYCRAADRVRLVQAAGRGRMAREDKVHGQAIKDIYVYPLVQDARQRLRGDLAR